MNAVRTLGLLFMRNLRQAPRIPTVLVFGIVMPLIQLFLFGAIFSRTTDIEGNPYAGVDYHAYIAPAIVLLTAFLGMANASAALIVDLRTGYFDKLRTTPARPAFTIVARLLAEMTRVSLQATLILLITVLMPGWDANVETGIAGGIAMVLLAVLFSACSVGLLVTALAMKTKSDQATQSSFPLFFILIFLSTAYMPKELLPGWLQTAVDFNPVDYLIQSLRELMLEGWPWQEIAITLGASAALATLLGLLNARIYRRMVG